MTDSSITYDKNGHAVTFSGPDAVELYRVASIASAIRLYVKCGIIPTRGVGIMKMLAIAGTYTGKTYKRNGATQAVEDLNVWVQTMKAALPHETSTC